MQNKLILLRCRLIRIYDGKFFVNHSILGPIYPMIIFPGPNSVQKWSRQAPGVIRMCKLKIRFFPSRHLIFSCSLNCLSLDSLSGDTLLGSFSKSTAPSVQFLDKASSSNNFLTICRNIFGSIRLCICSLVRSQNSRLENNSAQRFQSSKPSATPVC